MLAEAFWHAFAVLILQSTVKPSKGSKKVSVFTEGFEFTESGVRDGCTWNSWNIGEEIVQMAEKRQVCMVFLSHSCTGGCGCALDSILGSPCPRGCHLYTYCIHHSQNLVSYHPQCCLFFRREVWPTAYTILNLCALSSCIMMSLLNVT